MGLPDGRGVAIKITDGSPRARPVAMAGVLQRLGFDHETLTAQASAPVLGHGERVGEIRPCAETLAQLRRADRSLRRALIRAAGADVQADLGVDQGLLAGGDAADDQASASTGRHCA